MGVDDGRNASVANDTDALRIVTLAPHLAELVVSAGAESQLVGVSAYSDFPASLLSLPVVSDGFRIDAEALLAVRPDIVLAWGGGGQQASIDLLERLDLNYIQLDGRTLADVSDSLRRIGVLVGKASVAQAAADQFDAQIAALGAERMPVSVFYQIGASPLYTVNGQHFISELIVACGGTNIFADLPVMAPVVSVEAVVQRDPDVVLHAGQAHEPSIWRRWPELTVNQADNWVAIPGDLVARPSLRLAEGGAAICQALDEARERLPH